MNVNEDAIVYVSILLKVNEFHCLIIYFIFQLANKYKDVETPRGKCKYISNFARITLFQMCAHYFDTVKSYYCHMC